MDCPRPFCRSDVFFTRITLITSLCSFSSVIIKSLTSSCSCASGFVAGIYGWLLSLCFIFSFSFMIRSLRRFWFFLWVKLVLYVPIHFIGFTSVLPSNLKLSNASPISDSLNICLYCCNAFACLRYPFYLTICWIFTDSGLPYLCMTVFV